MLAGREAPYRTGAPVAASITSHLHLTCQFKHTLLLITVLTGHCFGVEQHVKHSYLAPTGFCPNCRQSKKAVNA